MSLDLVFYPDPRLRKVCAPVERFDEALARTAAEMLELMGARRGIGLAGPQVGFMRRLFVCNVTGKPEDAQVYANPELVDLVGAVEGEEGCLSIPDVNVPVRRAQRCTIRAYDLAGQPIEFTGEDLLARVWQHETDHLDGVLILDRTNEAAKLAHRRTLRDLEAQYRPRRAGAASR